MEISYQDINCKTIDRWVDDGWEWGKPISREVYAAAKNGQWDVKLTPVKFVPHDWFGDLKGRRVLGLAAGGGQQMPIFAALGAKCTVLDYSEKQLESERMVAQREGYDITIVRADMTKPAVRRQQLRSHLPSRLQLLCLRGAADLARMCAGPEARRAAAGGAGQRLQLRVRRGRDEDHQHPAL